MDAITLLKHDHEDVKKMLAELDDTTERAVKTREQTFTKLKAELEVHEAIEEEIFYPALKEHPKTKDIALEGYEEHHVVDTVMGEMLELPVSDETWTRQVHRHEGEPRAPHRGRRRRDVQAGASRCSTTRSSTSSATGWRARKKELQACSPARNVERPRRSRGFFASAERPTYAGIGGPAAPPCSLRDLRDLDRSPDRTPGSG